METLRTPEDIYSRILQCLRGSDIAVLATVVSRQGSGPREPGAMMLIRKDGYAEGTVGGGIMEADVLVAAAEVLQTGRPKLLAFEMTDRQASESGMICGGRMEILLEPLDGSNTAVVGTWERFNDARDEGRESWLVRCLTEGGSSYPQTGLGLLEKDRFDPGTLKISAQDMDRLREQGCRPEPVMLKLGVMRCFVQPALSPRTVFIFGAGHVAEALAPLCSLLGFRTVVVDDRSDFANERRFPRAADILVPESFAAVFDALEISRESFIVIMTRGHLHDRNVLCRALKTSAGYIGMIASSRKRDIIYRSLLEEGFPAEDLERVHSPIGLDIGARTPAEIAVSVAAELVAVRAGKEGRAGRRPSVPS